MDTVKRKEDATSKETLKDLEDEGTVDTNETDGPSPDGAFDEEDELKDADPV
jgi:hypothetical protein